MLRVPKAVSPGIVQGATAHLTEIVPYIGGSDGPRKLKIDHKKLDDAFKFNFHEDEKAQYQPDYMEGAHSGGQATSKGEPKKKSKKKDDKGKKKRDRGGSSKRKRGEDEEAGPSSVVPDWKKTKDKAEQKKRKKERTPTSKTTASMVAASRRIASLPIPRRPSAPARRKTRH
jgi:hypothetical protein